MAVPVGRARRRRAGGGRRGRRGGAVPGVARGSVVADGALRAEGARPRARVARSRAKRDPLRPVRRAGAPVAPGAPRPVRRSPGWCKVRGVCDLYPQVRERTVRTPATAGYMTLGERCARRYGSRRGAPPGPNAPQGAPDDRVDRAPDRASSGARRPATASRSRSGPRGRTRRWCSPATRRRSSARTRRRPTCSRAATRADFLEPFVGPQLDPDPARRRAPQPTPARAAALPRPGAQALDRATIRATRPRAPRHVAGRHAVQGAPEDAGADARGHPARDLRQSRRSRAEDARCAPRWTSPAEHART